MVFTFFLSLTFISWMAVRFPENVWFFLWKKSLRFHRRVCKLCFSQVWQQRAVFLEYWLFFVALSLVFHFLLFLYFLFKADSGPFYPSAEVLFFVTSYSIIASLCGMFVFFYLHRRQVFLALRRKQIWRCREAKLTVPRKELWFIFFGILFLYFLLLLTLGLVLYFGEGEALSDPFLSFVREVSKLRWS